MNEYRILLVDDEPHVLEGIAALLEELMDYNIDIYRAYSVREALHWLDEGRMDLVISDIEMGNISGLELLKEINLRCSECPVIFLTAHSSFVYAYQAFQNHAASYILKTESDETLVREITRVLDQIASRDRLSLDQLSPRPSSASVGIKLLNRFLHERIPAKVKSMMQQTGFDPCCDGFALFLCAYPNPDHCVRNQAVQELFRYHLQKRFTKFQCVPRGEQELIWLVQFSGEGNKREQVSLFGILEICQRSCLSTFDLTVSIAMHTFSIERQLPCEVYAEAAKDLARIRDSHEGILYARGLSDPSGVSISTPPDATSGCGAGVDAISNTVEWICRYIDENITGDVSLVKLSTLTGYNAQYLSGIFRKKTGQTLSRYIVGKRLESVYRLLADADIPIHEAARRLGFSSRSYFNRFVKQETHMTPQQLRAKLLAGNPFSANQ